MSDRLPFPRMPALALAGAVAAAAAVPLVAGSYVQYLASLALINGIAAIGLTILTGQAGQVSLCSSSFMAVGAYAVVWLTGPAALPFWGALPLAGLAAAVFGLVVGLPALRVRGYYLAVVTLGFLEITQILIESFPAVTGGVRGVSAVRPALSSGVRLGDAPFFHLTLAVTVLMTLLALTLVRSPLGSAMRAVHASERVAATLGFAVGPTKLAAFAVAAFYAGIAGGLFAPLVGFVDPLEFGLLTSIQHIIFAVFGGIGSIAGALFGAAVLSVLPEGLRDLKEYMELIYSVLLLLSLLLMPSGVAGLPARLRRPADPPRAAGRAVPARS